MGDKQIQKAGDGAQQLQVENLTIVNGIDEKRAREIVDERLHELMSQYSQEAHKLANVRIQEFADDLIPKLVKQNLLQSLGDPSVQVLLQEAEKSAASTEREADKELLSELLIHRIQKGENRHVRAGVSQAVKIVDEISDEALLGLTVAHSITSYLPMNANLKEWLKTADNIFGKIAYGVLPKGVEWIDHLDILNAIRRHSIGHIIDLEEIYARMIPGIIDVGIAKNSDKYHEAVEILDNARIRSASLIPHELREGYVRLCILNIDRLDLVTFKSEVTIKLNGNGMLYTVRVNQQLNEEQKQVLREVYSLYEEDAEKLKENKSKFMDFWNSYDSLILGGTKIWKT